MENPWKIWEIYGTCGKIWEHLGKWRLNSKIGGFNSMIYDSCLLV
jgi:hypothetical protein